MYAQAEKTKENSFLMKMQESRAVANSVAQSKNGGKQCSGFMDNRPEVIGRRKGQTLFKRHVQVGEPIQAKTNTDLYSSRKNTIASMVILQKRETNPNPAPSSSSVSDFTDVTLSEHHVVPYSKLETFLKEFKRKAAGTTAFTELSGFIPSNANLTVQELVNLNLITKEAGEALIADDVAPLDWLGKEESEKNDIINNNIDSSPGHLRRSAKRSLNSWSSTIDATRSGIDSDGMEPDWGIIMQYTTWAKGNLFVGPEGAKRTWDPGDSFDTWAQYFFHNTHYDLLEKINNDIEDAIEALKDEQKTIQDVKVQSVLTKLKTVATTYNAPTAFDASRWVKKDGSSKWKPTAMP